MVAPTSHHKRHALSLSNQEISGSFQKILPLVVTAVECEVTSRRGCGYQERQTTDTLEKTLFLVPSYPVFGGNKVERHMFQAVIQLYVVASHCACFFFLFSLKVTLWCNAKNLGNYNYPDWLVILLELSWLSNWFTLRSLSIGKQIRLFPFPWQRHTVHTHTYIHTCIYMYTYTHKHCWLLVWMWPVCWLINHMKWWNSSQFKDERLLFASQQDFICMQTLEIILPL